MSSPPRNIGAFMTSLLANDVAERVRLCQPRSRLRSGHSAGPHSAVCAETEDRNALPPRRAWRWRFPTRRNWCGRSGWRRAVRSSRHEHALKDGVAINIGGGFHHAFPDHGEGFCMIHDVAVAIRRMQRDDKIRTAMTVDCDVHHGNGTAAIFAGTRTPSDPLPSTSRRSTVGLLRAKFDKRMPATFSPSPFTSKTTTRRGSRIPR